MLVWCSRVCGVCCVVCDVWCGGVVVCDVVRTMEGIIAAVALVLESVSVPIATSFFTITNDHYKLSTGL
jgi:hypothetical protein